MAVLHKRRQTRLHILEGGGVEYGKGGFEARGVAEQIVRAAARGLVEQSARLPSACRPAILSAPSCIRESDL
jgi:hypothetical protein